MIALECDERKPRSIARRATRVTSISRADSERRLARIHTDFELRWGWYVSTRFRSGKPGKWTRRARGCLLPGLLTKVRWMLEPGYAQVSGYGSDCARSGSTA